MIRMLLLLSWRFALGSLVFSSDGSLVRPTQIAEGDISPFWG
jgi:hypothetical protein